MGRIFEHHVSSVENLQVFVGKLHLPAPIPSQPTTPLIIVLKCDLN